MNDTCLIPQGNLILRTLAMPSDTNVNGDIFGGWIMSQMDLAGSMLAKEITQGRTVTVGIEAIKFLKPVTVGDIVGCYGSVVKTGTTSVTIDIEVWVQPVIKAPENECPSFKVTEALFTFVAIDDMGKKRVLPKESI